MVILLSSSIFLTSLISAITGFGGGLILMILLVGLLSPLEAIIYHGIIQLLSNSFRLFLLREYIRLKPIYYFLCGAIIAGFILYYLNWSPSKFWIYFLCGAIPLAFLSIKKLSKLKSKLLNENYILCGLVTSVIGIFGGVSAGILDIFVPNSLKKEAIVAHKAAFSCINHLTKILVLGSFMLQMENSFFSTPAYTLPLVFCFIGTYLGKVILTKINNDWFLKIQNNFIVILSLYSLFMAIKSLY